MHSAHNQLTLYVEEVEQNLQRLPEAQSALRFLRVCSYALKFRQHEDGSCAEEAW